MAANVKVGFLCLQNVLHLRHIVPWIAADVSHVDVDIFHMEKQVLGILQTNDMVVDVAMYGTQWFELGQSLGRFDVAYIACVPQLVNIFEEIEKLWHEGAMRVRQNADFQHVISG